MKMLIKTRNIFASSAFSVLLGMATFSDVKAAEACQQERAALDHCMAHNFRAPDWCYPEKSAYLDCLSNVSYIPHYANAFWNSSSRRPKNNCYNYSANKATNNFAQPGYASGSPTFSDDPWSCTAVAAGAKGDSGISETSYFSSSNKRDTLLALVVAPGRDYHWYRRDSNNRWSHKPGQTSATNKDNSGNLITDPRNANRGIYTLFCGFFKTNSASQSQNTGAANIAGWMRSAQVAKEGDSIVSGEEASKITLLIYSGRKNPTMSLKEFNQLNSGVLSNQMKALGKSKQHSVSIQENMLDFIPSKLGYQGILIEDNDGLFGQKGAQILLHNGHVRVKAMPDSGGFKQLKIDMSAIEQNALETIAQRFKIDISTLME
ncbi:hypothetical protein [Aliikangiella coralliicola]|uniref:Uncharacterized protein n=1 Tax=Aliikangiella coralliicola TaxID=2592383 RepID=A0A545UE88_9GAMM|nr:hypothetical protein [Aliikangiella coralliicola]TQV87792.1 hypothetical protein FLL46_10420 [Aliikangiella coralliicola]